MNGTVRSLAFHEIVLMETTFVRLESLTYDNINIKGNKNE